MYGFTQALLNSQQQPSLSVVCDLVEQWKRRTRQDMTFETPVAVEHLDANGKHVIKPLDDATNVSSIRIGQLIGKGANSEAYNVQVTFTDNRKQQNLVLKRSTHTSNDQDMEELIAHVAVHCALNYKLHDILKQMSQQNRVKTPTVPAIVAAFNNNVTNFIIMERMRGSTLANYILKATRRQKIDALKQICVILIVLQDEFAFVHRDLHTNNVMVSNDGTVSLIDFGLAMLNISELKLGKAHRRYTTHRFNPTLDMLTLIMAMRQQEADLDLPELRPIHNQLLQNLATETPSKRFAAMAWTYKKFKGSTSQLKVMNGTQLHHILYRNAQDLIFTPTDPRNLLKVLDVAQ